MLAGSPRERSKELSAFDFPPQQEGSEPYQSFARVSAVKCQLPPRGGSQGSCWDGAPHRANREPSAASPGAARHPPCAPKGGLERRATAPNFHQGGLPNSQQVRKYPPQPSPTKTKPPGLSPRGLLCITLPSVDKGKSAGRGEKQALDTFSSSAGASLPSFCGLSSPSFSLPSGPSEFSGVRAGFRQG